MPSKLRSFFILLACGVSSIIVAFTAAALEDQIFGSEGGSVLASTAD